MGAPVWLCEGCGWWIFRTPVNPGDLTVPEIPETVRAHDCRAVTNRPVVVRTATQGAALDYIVPPPLPKPEPDLRGVDPEELVWAGHVLFDIVVKYGGALVPGVWAELTYAERERWNARANAVWEAQEFGRPTPADEPIWWCRSCDGGYTRKPDETEPPTDARTHICGAWPPGRARRDIVAAVWGDRRNYSPPTPI